MPGIDQLNANVNRQIQTKLADGSLTQDQATQLQGDLSNLNSAISSGDPAQIKQAFQSLRGDAEKDGIKVGKKHGHHGHHKGPSLQDVEQAAQAGDPQAKAILDQVNQISSAAQAGDPQAQQLMQELQSGASVSRVLGGQASQTNNPYWATGDSFSRTG